MLPSQGIVGVLLVILVSHLASKPVAGQSSVCINVTDTFEPISGQAQVPILHYDQRYFKILRPKMSFGYLFQQNGPTVDHTLMTDQGNYFIFSQYVCRGRNLTRTSVSTTEYYCPASSSSTATTCALTFYYSMSGPYAGLLSFGTRFRRSGFFLGDQGTGTGWKEHVVQESFPAGEPVQFIFNFTCNPRPLILNTSTLSNFAAGDIGLDDISITCRCPVSTCSTPTTAAATPVTTALGTSDPAAAVTTTLAASIPAAATGTSQSPSTMSTTTTTTSTVALPVSSSCQGVACITATSTPDSQQTNAPGSQPDSATSTATVLATTANLSSESSSQTVIIAVVVGVLAALLLIVVVVFCHRRRRTTEKTAISQPSTAALMARNSPESAAGLDVKFNNPTYDGRDLTGAAEPQENGAGHLNYVAVLSSQRPMQAAPTVPQTNGFPVVARQTDGLSSRQQTPSVGSDYDEPESHAIRQNAFYCQAEAPQNRSPTKDLPANGVNNGTLPRYDHLMHEDINPEVYAQPFQEPGNTPAAIYNQLSGQAYRHIPNVHVTMHEKIGSGSFGIVFRGVWKMPNGMCVDTAIKQLRPNASEDMRLKLLQEAAIMGQFNHRNVVKLYGVVTDGPETLMVVELMGEDLKTQLVDLRAKGPHGASEKAFIGFASDIAEGMLYLSSRGFVHRDLAARNVMLDARRACKIGDFGMSRDLEDNNYYTSAGGAIPVKWTAPEAIHFRQYSHASDVWSYGIILYEIFTMGRKPYAGWPNEEVAQKVRRGYRLPSPENCRPVIYKLMTDCWEEDKHRRPSFSDIVLRVRAIQSGTPLTNGQPSATSSSRDKSATDSLTKVSAYSGNDTTSSPSPRAVSPSVDSFAMTAMTPELVYDTAEDVAKNRVSYTAAEMSQNSVRRHNRVQADAARTSPSRDSDYDDVIITGSRPTSSYTESDI